MAAAADRGRGCAAVWVGRTASSFPVPPRRTRECPASASALMGAERQTNIQCRRPRLTLRQPGDLPGIQRVDGPDDEEFVAIHEFAEHRLGSADLADHVLDVD